jgi:hypothetical protein
MTLQSHLTPSLPWASSSRARTMRDSHRCSTSSWGAGATDTYGVHSRRSGHSSSCLSSRRSVSKHVWRSRRTSFDPHRGCSLLPAQPPNHWRPYPPPTFAHGIPVPPGIQHPNSGPFPMMGPCGRMPNHAPFSINKHVQAPSNISLGPGSAIMQPMFEQRNIMYLPSANIAGQSVQFQEWGSRSRWALLADRLHQMHRL